MAKALQHPVLAYIEDLPPDERVEEAMAQLRLLLDPQPTRLAAYQSLYGLNATESRLLDHMVIRRGECVTKEALVAAAIENEEVDPRIIDVYICKIRKKVGPGVVETARGLGYLVSAEKGAEIDAAVAARAAVTRVEATYYSNRGQPWTAEDDLTLVQMLANGSELWAIADELDRSERAVLDRIRVKKLRGIYARPR